MTLHKVLLYQDSHILFYLSSSFLIISQVVFILSFIGCACGEWQLTLPLPLTLFLIIQLHSMS